jgi:hypothetical protein
VHEKFVSLQRTTKSSKPYLFIPDEKMTVKHLIKSTVFFCTLFCGLYVLPASLYGKNVVLPLTLDYQLLTTLLERSAFTDGNNTAMLVGRGSDCIQVRVSEPAYSSSGSLLRLEMRLYVKLGTAVGDTCFLPMEWEGYVSLLQQPVFESEKFSLSFKTVDSKLYTMEHQPASVAGFVWDFVKSSVYPYLDQVRINLAPPVADLKTFLMPLFPRQATEATQRMLDALHGGKVFVHEDAVSVELIADVETIYEPAVDGEQPLRADEIQNIIELWESWDAFLVQLITAMAEQFLNDADRQVLLDVLLSTRHHFTTVLEARKIDKDFVRVQFVNAWQQLAPMFRKQLSLESSDNTFGYLAFFTAADALAVFDRMGPTLGVEISQQGLLRLARMLDSKIKVLHYAPEINVRMRELLQLPGMKEDSSPSMDIEEIDLEDEREEQSPLSYLLNFISQPVYAANTPTFKEILQWRVPKRDVDNYILRVRKVLDETVVKILARRSIPESLEPMFKVMIPAMAWQESCLRQFVERKRKLTYLLSYNNSSVGVMQVNERVWRGIYDRNRLRWDIRYNVLAGCEIADLYLRKYALRKTGSAGTLDSDTLARAVYAMYNGGPGQYEKFLKRARADKYFRSDRLFAEKFDWVLTDNWQHLSVCLIGG